MSAPEIAVIGGGSWGTTLADVIGAAGHPVHLWARSEEACREINKKHTNARYLKDLSLSERIEATPDLQQAVAGKRIVLMVVPSKAFRSVVEHMGDILTPDQYVLHATKGLEPGTHFRMSQIILQETCVRQIGVLSGPNIAPEICAGKPAGIVLASRFPMVVEAGQRVLVCKDLPRLRVYNNDDVVGVELAGALKNIVAIAAGIVTAMELGENTKALLMTRGLAEIARVGVAMGARALTFSGVAGIGDLIATCASPLSRNHRLGAALAHGKTLEEAVDSLGMVAEGVNTTAVVREVIEQHGLDAPLLETVHRVLFRGLSPADAVLELMRLSSRDDVDHALFA
jgi:glycerol-3-phosphate dehydrogenase (NAD(P)+)